MGKELNKHTPNSDELLKRLNANDSNGLDDFEKEALEGFDSLDNIEQAKQLTNSVNAKIDEVYFKKGSAKKGMMYLSMAAGLVLVVGLSIFFVNFLGQNKEVAMSAETKNTEQLANEVSKPTDIAPAPLEEQKAGGKASAGDDAKPVVDAITETAATGAKDISSTDRRANNQADKDDGLTSRMVLKESKKPESTTEKSPKTSDAESGYDFKQAEKDKISQGPVINNPASPSVVIADQKNKAKEETELYANEKSVSTKGNAATTPANSSALAGGVGGKEAKKKSESTRKKASGEALGNEDYKSSNDELAKTQTTSNNNNAPSETKRDESGSLHNVEFSNHAYSKPQDYLKVEINKSEMLKTNVKAFKAELTINEKGTVTAVKFLTPLDNTCTGCKKELEKILLNMPGWKPSAAKKSVKETVSYIDQ